MTCRPTLDLPTGVPNVAHLAGVCSAVCKGWLDRRGCRVADVVVQGRATALSDIDE